jgi:hypothetical protein
VKKSEEMKQAVTGLVEKGLSLSRAGSVLGMHHCTTLRWKKDDEDFADAIRQAESPWESPIGHEWASREMNRSEHCSSLLDCKWSRLTDSNRRPTDYKSM